MSGFLVYTKTNGRINAFKCEEIPLNSDEKEVHISFHKQALTDEEMLLSIQVLTERYPPPANKE